MFYFILTMITIINGDDLFSGNGLQTYAHTILHDRVIKADCSTNNDCYDLLCSYIFQPVYLVIVDPKAWIGDCNKLTSSDNRILNGYIDVIYTNSLPKTYHLLTPKKTSIQLCKLAKDNNVRQIQYTIWNCTLINKFFNYQKKID